MNPLSAITTGDTLPLPRMNLTRSTPNAADFAQQLTTATAGKSASPTQMDRLTEVGDELVASAFVLPLLEQVRDDPFKSDLFHGGRGEEIFGQQLDVIMAERITASSNFGVGAALVERFRPPAAMPDAVRGRAKVNTRG